MNPQDRNAFIQTLKANCGSLNSKSFCRPLIAGSVLPGCTVMLPLGFSALSPAGRSRPACFLATGGQGGCRWDPAERKLALEAGWNVHTRCTAPHRRVKDLKGAESGVLGPRRGAGSSFLGHHSHPLLEHPSGFTGRLHIYMLYGHFKL